MSGNTRIEKLAEAEAIVDIDGFASDAASAKASTNALKTAVNETPRDPLVGLTEKLIVVFRPLVMLLCAPAVLLKMFNRKQLLGRC